MTLSEYVHYHQLDYYFSESKRTLIGSAILSSAVLYILYTLSAPLNMAMSWFIVLSLISALRFFLGDNFSHDFSRSKEQIHYYHNRNLVYLSLTGILWAFAYWMMMKYGDNSYDLVAILILIGFIGSTVLSAGNNLHYYIALNLLPTIVAFSYYMMQESHSVSVAPPLIILAVGFIFSSAYSYSQKTIQNLSNDFQLKSSKKDVISALGRAGEYRDEDTGNHILRMSHSCYLMAKALGMSEERAREIEYASTLHDVGKIGIPDNILLKKDRLSDEEMEIMKSHTMIGLKILETVDSPIVEVAKKITLTHHEKWDGSGYPNGLQATDIPIEGRIAAICDVFDALTSERPYKKPWSFDDAIEYLIDNSGSHFDPELVPIFIEVAPDVISYHHSRP